MNLKLTVINSLTKSPECWIDAVGSVSGSHDNDMGSLLQTIHESEQLRNNAPLNLSVGLKTKKTCMFTIHTSAEFQHLKSFCHFSLLVELHYIS